MSLKINQEIPNFKQKAYLNGNTIEIDFHKYIENKWTILFSHPSDFTPVCTTELGYGQKIINEFKDLNTQLIALSVDSIESHKQWIPDIIETQSLNSFDYPILADEDKSVSLLLDLIHPEADNNFTVRSVFFIDPNKKVRTILTYPHIIGRNFEEILRIIVALQTADKYKVATPVNWKKGEKAIIPPAIKDLTNYNDVEEIKSYLRYTTLK